MVQRQYEQGQHEAGQYERNQYDEGQYEWGQQQHVAGQQLESGHHEGGQDNGGQYEVSQQVQHDKGEPERYNQDTNMKQEEPFPKLDEKQECTDSTPAPEQKTYQEHEHQQEKQQEQEQPDKTAQEIGGAQNSADDEQKDKD